jgi:hypothetical protein
MTAESEYSNIYEITREWSLIGTTLTTYRANPTIQWSQKASSVIYEITREWPLIGTTLTTYSANPDTIQWPRKASSIIYEITREWPLVQYNTYQSRNLSLQSSVEACLGSGKHRRLLHENQYISIQYSARHL